MINMQEEISAIWALEIQEIEGDALRILNEYLQENNIRPDSPLLQNITQDSIIVAKELYAEIQVKFPFDGRYIDLKYVEYDPNKKPDPDGKLVEGMKHFIENQGGLSKFPFIPGYTTASKSLPISSVAINRLAYALAYNRVNRGRINRRGKGWYNRGRGRFISKIKSTLTQRIALKIAERVALNLQS